MNSTTLQELKAQRMALDAQIQAAEDEIARSGESIVVDGQTFDKVADFEGSLPSPADTDYFPTYRKDSNGDIVSTGEITYAGLVDAFAEEATTILNQAIAAGNTAVGNISDAQAAALGAIGQDDSSGARGAAVSSIGTAKDNALSAIGQTDSEGARKNALDAISAALTSALSSIGQSDTAGARGDAITAIATALANALASIGQTDNEGARKAALDAISAAKAAALSAIGESDTTGARGDAITAINALYTAIQQTITAATSTIDGLISEAEAAKAGAEAARDEAEQIAGSVDADALIAQMNQIKSMFMGYKTTIGDGSTLTYTITHSLGTQDIMPMIGGDSVPEWELTTVDANSVSITFTEAPAASSITVLILPVRTAS